MTIYQPDTRDTIILRMHTSETKPSFREMAEATKMSVSSIQYRIAKLAKNGLLEIPESKKARKIKLTEKGFQALGTSSNRPKSEEAPA